MSIPQSKECQAGPFHSSSKNLLGCPSWRKRGVIAQMNCCSIRNECLYLLALHEYSCWHYHSIRVLVNLQTAYLQHCLVMNPLEVLYDMTFVGKGVGAQWALELGLDGVTFFMNGEPIASVS